jgi:hypothetical protein
MLISSFVVSGTIFDNLLRLMPFVIAQTDKGQSNRFLIQRESRRVSPAGLFVAAEQKEPPRLQARRPLD